MDEDTRSLDYSSCDHGCSRRYTEPKKLRISARAMGASSHVSKRLGFQNQSLGLKV